MFRAILIRKLYSFIDVFREHDPTAVFQRLDNCFRTRQGFDLPAYFHLNGFSQLL